MYVYILFLSLLSLSKEIEDYLTYDTTHKHGIKINIKICDDNTFEINKHKINLFNERDAKKICWNCDYLFDATGAYLTTEKCKGHNAPYIIMSSPPKDSTPTFIYSVNVMCLFIVLFLVVW